MALYWATPICILTYIIWTKYQAIPPKIPPPKAGIYPTLVFGRNWYNNEKVIIRIPIGRALSKNFYTHITGRIA